jgi:hypothetical protein
MPPRLSWTSRIPLMVQQLSSLHAPVVDRNACEQIFGVKRRRAIDLMQHFGGYRSGNTILLDRIGLISKLQQLNQSPETAQELRRKQRIAEELDSANRCWHARRVSVTAPAGVRDFQLEDMHPDITLGPGSLVVRFTSSDELFTRLYELSQIAVNDLDRVCDAVDVIHR